MPCTIVQYISMASVSAIAITPSPGDVLAEDDVLSDLARYRTWLESIDVILLLGGGAPLSPLEPPLYVQRRCDVVARLVHSLVDEGDGDNGHAGPSVVCLSAGTAHVPQYITPGTGLPLWESTASAGYLLRHAEFPMSPGRVYAETTSYDTISNAFYSRAAFADVNERWNRVLVVTNEFHVGRSKAIFDWVFHAPPVNKDSAYELYYLSCNNVGLADEAVKSRKEHEARGEANVRGLSERYATLNGVWEFLTTEHSFYSAEKLVKAALGEGGVFVSGADETLKASYGSGGGGGTGGSAIQYKDGKVILSLDVYFIAVALVIAMGILFVKRKLFLGIARQRKNHMR